jgi:hypothetical protein
MQLAPLVIRAILRELIGASHVFRHGTSLVRQLVDLHG